MEGGWAEGSSPFSVGVRWGALRQQAGVVQSSPEPWPGGSPSLTRLLPLVLAATGCAPGEGGGGVGLYLVLDV